MIVRRVVTGAYEFAVRRLRHADIPQVVDYWLSRSEEDLIRMGADASKLPQREEFEASLGRILETPDAVCQTYYLIWLLDDTPIGFSSLKNIVHGKTGAIHLHIWDSSFTGKGYGAALFCLSAIGFYAMFNLESIKCEPRASNPLPNRMLQKVGFPLLKTYVGASSELSLTCKLNRYAITRNIAEAYLESLES